VPSVGTGHSDGVDMNKGASSMSQAPPSRVHVHSLADWGPFQETDHWQSVQQTIQIALRSNQLLSKPQPQHICQLAHLDMAWIRVASHHWQLGDIIKGGPCSFGAKCCLVQNDLPFDIFCGCGISVA
jgi:hypothetical protein